MLVLATNEWRVPALVANQWLSLAKIALKMSLADRSRSLVANTSMCGEGISVMGLLTVWELAFRRVRDDPKLPDHDGKVVPKPK